MATEVDEKPMEENTGEEDSTGNMEVDSVDEQVAAEWVFRNNFVSSYWLFLSLWEGLG